VGLIHRSRAMVGQQGIILLVVVGSLHIAVGDIDLGGQHYKVVGDIGVVRHMAVNILLEQPRYRTVVVNTPL